MRTPYDQIRVPRERALAELADRQYGVVTQLQLVALGFGRGAIRHRVATGRLYAVHRGVYSVGRPRPIGRAVWMAAILACGDGDPLLSHRCAGDLLGIAPSAATRVDVTVTARRPGRPGITLHCVRCLHPDDRAEVDGIPVTSVARTLLDLAEVVSPDRLARAFERAERLRLLDMRAIEDLCSRSRGRHGLKPLRALVSDYAPAVVETRSELESRFLRSCRRAGLPPPSVNVAVEGFEVDALWRDQRLIVELDGYLFHGTRLAFERDRERDARLQLAGYRVLRVTSRRLDREPDAIAAAVRSLLSASSRR